MRKRLLGWILVIIGLLIILLPFLTSSTGFFITAFAVNPQPLPIKFELNLPLLIVGVVIMAVGYSLLHSTQKVKSVLKL